MSATSKGDRPVLRAGQVPHHSAMLLWATFKLALQYYIVSTQQSGSKQYFGCRARPRLTSYLAPFQFWSSGFDVAQIRQSTVSSSSFHAMVNRFASTGIPNRISSVSLLKYARAWGVLKREARFGLLFPLSFFSRGFQTKGHQWSSPCLSRDVRGLRNCCTK